MQELRTQPFKFLFIILWMILSHGVLSSCVAPRGSIPSNSTLVQYTDKELNLVDLHSSYVGLLPLNSATNNDTTLNGVVEESLQRAIKGENPEMKITSQMIIRDIITQNRLDKSYSKAINSLIYQNEIDSAFFYNLGMKSKCYYLLSTSIDDNPSKIDCNLIDINKGKVVWKAVSFSTKHGTQYDMIKSAAKGVGKNLGQEKSDNIDYRHNKNNQHSDFTMLYVFLAVVLGVLIGLLILYGAILLIAYAFSGLGHM